MDYGKALEEVWQWRESVERELEGVPPKSRVEHINKKAHKACRKYGIKVRMQPKHAVHAHP